MQRHCPNRCAAGVLKHTLRHGIPCLGGRRFSRQLFKHFTPDSLSAVPSSALPGQASSTAIPPQETTLAISWPSVVRVRCFAVIPKPQLPRHPRRRGSMSDRGSSIILHTVSFKVTISTEATAARGHACQHPGLPLHHYKTPLTIRVFIAFKSFDMLHHPVHVLFSFAHLRLPQLRCAGCVSPLCEPAQRSSGGPPSPPNSRPRGPQFYGGSDQRCYLPRWLDPCKTILKRLCGTHSQSPAGLFRDASPN